jgi:hypothetical protein
MRGRYLLGLSSANRQAAGVVTGEEVQVDVEYDAEPDPLVSTVLHAFGQRQLPR